jgi:hypothetical protein
MTITPIRPDVAAPLFLAPEVTLPPWITHPTYCDGTCPEWYDKQDESIFHTGEFGTVDAYNGDTEKPVEVTVTASRFDMLTERGESEVHVLGGYDLMFKPNAARQFGSMVAAAAEAVDPLPVGETQVQARHVLVGDEILTDDGWQHVYLTLITEYDDPAYLFTPERDGDTDGWSYSPTTPIRVRRSTGVLTIAAEDIRYDDHLLTDHGWQAVEGAMVSARTQFVAVFTDERNGDDSDGWQFAFGDEITVRRVAR